MSKRIDITGQRFGRWIVLEFVEWHPGESLWRCRCDCGTESIIKSQHLRSGASRSCGCLKGEVTAARNWRHGHCAHPLFRLWLQMIDRCENPQNKWFHRYGGRGIAICDRWHDFTLFCEDVSPRPAGKTLDRIDNDGPYSPDNFRWATPKEQASNRHV